MFNLIIYLLLVTPFPALYLLKYVTKVFFNNIDEKFIYPLFFNIIVCVELLILYFAFDFLGPLIIVIFGIIASLIYISFSYFTSEKIEQKKLLLKWNKVIKYYIIRAYILMIIISFLVHVINSAFL